MLFGSVMFHSALRSFLVAAVVVFVFQAWTGRAAGFSELEHRAHWLDSLGLPYNAMWTPPGETSAWKMDCSNTARWLHRETHGTVLPRTGSDQYVFFRERGRFRRAGTNPNRLMRELRRGDFLFWENTYRPQRKPPITHVMVYLGRDQQGRMWMAGSQGRSGVGIHEFKPRMPMGGYNWFLWFRREGRFIGYARP
jgi:cell wall-associated NlpC family hydrolase